MSWPAGRVLELWDRRSLKPVMLLEPGDPRSRLRFLNARGRAETAGGSRVAHDTGLDLDPSGAPEEAAARLRSWDEEASRLASELDVETLWEVVAEMDPPEAGVEDLAALAGGEAGGRQRSAVLRALLADPLFFERRDDRWAARPSDRVAQARRREESAERRAAEEEDFRRSLNEAASGLPPAEGFRQRHELTLAALEGIVVAGLSHPGAAKALALLPGSPKPGSEEAREAAFGALVSLGVMDEDEDLGRRRIGIPDEFPAEVEAAAREAAERGPEPGLASGARDDLRDLVLLAVDDPLTSEVDDAVGILGPGPQPGTTVVAVAVADPAAFVHPGDPVDVEALSRALGHYLPTGVLPMLPAVLGEEAASLKEAEERPAVVFLCTLSSGGEILGFEPRLARIRGVRRLAYEEAAARIEAGDQPAAALHALARARLLRRFRSGAVVLRQPEVSARVEGGQVVLDRTDLSSPGRVLVSEMMVLAGEGVARWLADRGVPALYRRQPPPDDLPEAAGDEGVLDAPYDPVLVRAVRRKMRPSEVRTEPGPHSGLGIEMYCQATSPLRRYQDLAVHRQIRALLLGKEPPYGLEDLQVIAATTEAAERTMRSAERQSREFWLLRHVAGRKGEEVDAVVLETGERWTLLEVQAWLHTARVPPRPGHRPGATVRVRVTEVSPRSGLLRVEEVG